MNDTAKEAHHRASPGFRVAMRLAEPTTEEGLRLLEAFRAIPCAATRAQVLQLIESLPPKLLGRHSA